MENGQVSSRSLKMKGFEMGKSWENQGTSGKIWWKIWETPV